MTPPPAASVPEIPQRRRRRTASSQDTLGDARHRFRSTPPPDPARIVYPLVAYPPRRAAGAHNGGPGGPGGEGGEGAGQRPTPLTREDTIPESLCRACCAPGPHDPRLARDYLGSLEWSGAFARYLSTATLPWWRQPYVVARLGKRDPRALRLVQLANEVAEATDTPLIQVVPQVAPRLGLRARPAWLLYLRTEQIVQRVYRVRTTQAA